MNKTKIKLFLTLSILFCLSLSFFSFVDKSEYQRVRDIIKRGNDLMYQVGMINIKFKNDVSFTKSGFGILRLDNMLKSYKLTDIIQPHPLNKDVSRRMIGDEELARVFRVLYDSDADPFDVAESILNENKDILDWAEPSFVYKPDYIPNDPSISQQWHISKIASYQAWDLSRGDTNIIIGIVDSGTDYEHSDLNANYKWNWADPIDGIDNDGNGYIDDFMGWDFGDNDNNPDCGIQANDHGSHVSGCAAQVADNGVHGAGIGFKCKFRVTKHSDQYGNGLYYTDAGVVYQYQNGAKVINCSYGSSTYNSYSQMVMNNAWANGVVICASSGNQYLNTPRYPASYDNVVSVAATNSSDIKADFSNWHTTVDVCAPGQNILSTVWKNGYGSWDGTSMSAPITSGTVALIRSMYPSWTPQQVVDRLKLGVDSIYNLNPSYIGMLGTGRINAFKCLADKPIVKIVSYQHTDSIYGNNDKIYDIDEVIPIAISFKNTHFAGTDASVRLTTSSPYITFVQDSVYIGNISAYGTFATTYANTFKVKANSSCPFDAAITFNIGYSNTVYPDNSAGSFTITFRQGFATHNINNLKLSLTKDGAVGKKTQAYGNGLFIGSGTVNNIYEGGLMIGLNNTQVSDVCRRGQSPANVSDTDFVASLCYHLNTPGTLSGQDGFGIFNDDGAGASKIGVEVNSFSYAYNTTGDENYILLKFRIKNNTSSNLNNLYAGIYIWYAPNGNFISNNITRYNSTNRVAYTYNTTVSNNYLGLALMTNQTANFRIFNSTEVLTGFTTQEKWDGLSGGIYNDSLGPGGNPFVLAFGPFNLTPNQAESIGFAVISATDAGDLFTKTNTARTKYQTVGVTNISENVPSVYTLSQNYPNPFNPATTIKFGIPKNDFVNIRVYDILGREVAELVNEQLNAGFYEVNFNAAKLASGMYFYRIETRNFIDVKKMMLIK
ncbi:MAG: T9SS type A sorting domain-containing protein [Ignavibacteria bacterium]|nr:T9SS type A sorting domain-containing protein [Ignavibacteria bacterium]